MEEFEYKVAKIFDCATKKNKEELSKKIEAALNEYGKDGWELVSTSNLEPLEDDNITCMDIFAVFKRIKWN